MADYKADLTLTAQDGTSKHLTGTLSDVPTNTLDFSANFMARGVDYNMRTQDDWNAVFADGISKGVSVYCLEQNTDATRHDFYITNTPAGQSMRVFMPMGSYGMGHRSVNIRLGKCMGPVNIAFQWMCPDPGSNLWVNGGGKWGPAIQYGPIQSGPTGGIRFMPVWAAGGSQLGKQDITVAIQNQPNGGQWLQPPYYAYRPIEYGHVYDIRLRMTGGGGKTESGLQLKPTSVRCQYWKDDDPVMDYTASTDNQNAQQGIADVMVDWTCFFGGTAQNAAPADCNFVFGPKFRIWVESQ